MLKKTFRVDGMHCSGCVMRVEGIEDELPGIKSIEASYKKGQMQVTFDERQVSSEQIIAAVGQKGYAAALME
ncbi:MAG TPA: copper-binding protein [Chloroflexi bacterium]|nr:copper-binding protein [Chloroflexota bacterium]